MIEGVPQVRYAKAGDTHIAYQLFGDGDATIVAVPPMAQNVELAWEWPAIRHMLEGFASFSRYLHFDKRGTGASDRTLPVPEIDQRVDDLVAVMDDAGIDRGYLFGVSEGGPMALLFAATYPDRVDGIVLEGSGARLLDRDAVIGATSEDEAARLERFQYFSEVWGTPNSITVDIFAPSLAGDPEFRRWHERYERQAASREAIMTLLLMNGLMDAREVLPSIEAPVLLLHRVDDPVVSIRFAREAEAALPNARLVELPGVDHFTYAADVDAVLVEIERFVTGAVRHDRTPIRRPTVSVTTLGRFAVAIDGVEVADGEWGSRLARQLLKRLAVARGWPVTREELIDLLWPGEVDHERLRSRLSVQLSTVRRILHGGVLADRTSVRLDLHHVELDLVRFDGLTADGDLLAAYGGELLPDDRYEDWAGPPRAELHARFTAAAHRLLDAALAHGEHAATVELAVRVLAADPYDERAHHSVIRAAHAQGGRPRSLDAYEQYRQRMIELGVEPLDHGELVGE